VAEPDGQGSPTERLVAARRRALLGSNIELDLKKYEVSSDWKKRANPGNALTARNVAELIESLRAEGKSAKTQIDARVMAVNPREQTRRLVRLNRAQFLEQTRQATQRKFRFLEQGDPFGWDLDCGGAGTSNLVGHDFIPLLGGAFFKQLYLQDALAQFATCFHAYHHDPIARFIVNATRDFVLGRGYRVDSEDKKALSIWRAFEDANNLAELMDWMCIELAIYGESMLWKLPDLQSKIVYNVLPKNIPHGLLPRVRLVDPSAIWEIVTFPEDITRVLYYQWVAPTQYQMYTGEKNGEYVPSLKFIMQQIPAAQMLHLKVNTVSNEKRGRSDLFPVLGYLKRLRDSVNYSIIGQQKQAAWAIDTTIEGSQADLDQYVNDEQTAGTIREAGSEFVHTKAVKREFLSAPAGQGAHGLAFEWCMSMIAAGVGVPISYFGMHLSGGQTKASAIVGTEPVTKKWEARQMKVERLLQNLWGMVMDRFGMPDAECEITFPELMSQDRSKKIQDLILAEECGAISHEHMSTGVAKELQRTSYDYKQEQAHIAAEKPKSAGLPSNPLSSPATLAKVPAPPVAGGDDGNTLDGEDRVAQKVHDGQL